jgi:hypothetical protein
VIAILVQMILQRLSKPVEGKPDDNPNH